MFLWVDVDECQADTDNCDPNAQCTNTVGSFTCACNTGFTGDGITCEGMNSRTSDTILQCTSRVDVDECQADTDNCDPNAQCTNIVGSFTCACNTGFTGNGVTCEGMNSKLAKVYFSALMGRC